MKGRDLKAKLRAVLTSGDPKQIDETIGSYPEQRVISPLFSFLYDSNEKLKHNAIMTMGTVVANLAEKNMESARVVMRRLMWNLNDESGGVGWGSPEAMGEIMAKHQKLAEEYHKILISYIDPSGNYIEHEGLKKGILWAIWRLAQVYPNILKRSIPFLLSYLKSDDESICMSASKAIVSIDPAAIHLIPSRYISELDVISRDSKEIK